MARHIGLLYDALLAAESDKLKVQLSLEGDEPETEEEANIAAPIEGRFTLVRASRDTTTHTTPKELGFHVQAEDKEPLKFRRYLRNARIITSQNVELGLTVEEFEIGPAVNIQCEKLTLGSQSLIVGGRIRPALSTIAGKEVVLEAHSFEGALNKRPFDSVPLVVSWPGARSFPWTEFATETPVANDGDRRFLDCYRRLRRILMVFESGSAGQLSKLRDKIDHSRILKGVIGERLLQQLRTDGIIYIDGSFYVLNQDIFSARLAIDREGVNQLKSTPQLSQYLANFIAANPNIF